MTYSWQKAELLSPQRNDLKIVTRPVLANKPVPPLSFGWVCRSVADKDICCEKLNQKHGILEIL